MHSLSLTLVGALVLLSCLFPIPSPAGTGHDKGKITSATAKGRSEGEASKLVCGTIDQYRSTPKSSGDRDLSITTASGLKTRILFEESYQEQERLFRDSLPVRGCVAFADSTAGIEGTYINFRGFIPRSETQLSSGPSVQGFHTQCGTVDVWRRPPRIGGDRDLTIETAHGRQRLIFAEGLESLGENLRSRIPVRTCLGYAIDSATEIEGSYVTVIASFEELLLPRARPRRRPNRPQ